MDFGAPLPYKNIAGGNHLAVIFLYAKALGCGIPTITGAADALLMGKKL